MKALLTWAVVLLVLLLLARMKVGIRFCWENDQAKLRILIGGLRISLPKEKKKKETEAKKALKETSETSAKEAKPTDSGKRWAMAALTHWQDILTLIGRVLQTPTLHLLRAYISVGGPDASDCALNYGRIWAGIGAVLPVLENTFHIDQQDIQVTCDYEKEKTTYFVQTEITVRIYEIFTLAAAGLKLFFRIYRETKDNKKAV